MLCGQLTVRTATAADDYTVAVVPSDDAHLAQPVARDARLTADQILDMVRRAVDLLGGMSYVVPDTARVVLLKPNDGASAEARSGVITDDRVVRAVALLVHEAAPQARILIAEAAGGWLAPTYRDSVDMRSTFGGDLVVDGFELAGYRAVVAELQARGIDIECYDLNFDRVYSLHPEGGGLATDEYSVAASILDADVWINLPVAKTHGAKITCAMKNHFGILPGRVYGWSKSNGTAQHPGMPHSPRLIDEAWIDLYGLTRQDLTVVDMIAGSEAGAFEENKTHRANTVLAGANPIATDLVVGKLMGFNPDDFEFAELAWQHELGPRNLDHVEVRGVADLQPLVSRWKKAGMSYGDWGEWAEHADYGMGPRYWTLLGPLPRDHAFTPAELTALEPVPGRDGWSDVVFFGDDKINLDKHFDDPVNCAVYAVTRFTMARSDSVRFWVGSDDGLQMWLDGEPIYRHRGRRRHVLGGDRLPGYVEAGEHTLLVRAEQGRGDFDFSINVCEPIDDPLYAGNRYPGVRYYVEPEADVALAAQRVGAEDAGGDFGGDVEESNVVTLEGIDPLERSRTAPDTIEMAAPVPGRADLVGLLVQLAGIERPDLDEGALAVLGTMPFTMGHGGIGREGWYPDYGPPLSRILDWLGLRYAVTYGYGQRETLKTIQGWLAEGRIPVVPNLQQSRRWWMNRAPEWGLVTGYRQAGDTVELRQARPSGVHWVTVTDNWRGTMPGGVRVTCPLVVAAAGGTALSPEALTDSIAALALELGAPRWLEETSGSWGSTKVAGGLLGWDWWTIDWERLPLTPAWAAEEETLDRLGRLSMRFLPDVTEGRSQAAAYFAGAAQRADGQRRDLLLRVATGYEQVVRALEELAHDLPSPAPGGGRGGRSRQPQAEPAPPDLDRIPQARPLVAQARDGERRALNALAELLGEPAMPPPVPDPLAHKDRGLRLFHWDAVTDGSVYTLSLSGRQLAVDLVDGNEADSLDWKVENPVPEKAGWEVAVEAGPSGAGIYQVAQQPSADNGWQTVIVADDTHAWTHHNAPSLTVWAVPRK